MISKIRQFGLKWLAVVAISAAFICSLWVNFGIRAPVEARDKTVGLMVDYDELKRIADGSHDDIDFADMLRKASLAGATGLVVRERLLADWEAAGDVIVFSGSQLGFQLENRYGESADEMTAGLEITSGNTYILTKDPLIYDQIFSLLEVKARYPKAFAIPGYIGIETQLHSSEQVTLGLGFPLAQLEEAAAAGYQIIPRLRNWEPLTQNSLTETFRWVGMIPNVAAVGFNDQSMPGGTGPIIQDRLAEAVASLGKPLVSFEFYDQAGLPGLAARLDYNLMRVHAISENEMSRYTDFQVAMDRYSLAATERNIRFIYIRFQGLINPAASMVDNMDLITGVREGLIADGLAIGAPEPIAAYTIGMIPMFLLGTGIIAASGWLFAMAAEPFARKKLYLPYGMLMVFGCLIWAVLMFVAPTISRKLLALAGAIVFPCLSVLLTLIYKPKDCTAETVFKRTVRAIVQLLVMSAMVIVGAMITSAILAEPLFMLKIDSFVGVKASHIIPLALAPLILWLREEDWYGIMSGTVKSSVKLWQLVVGVILLAGLAVYVLRTGNESSELVSGFEVQVRQTLKNVLGVRPRTKEFLIGHPIMLVLLFYGYKLNMFSLVAVGLIGQVSIINTYAHLHTPLMISLLRSANGLWIGILIGVIAIVIVQCTLRRVQTLSVKYAKANEKAVI